VNTWSSLELLQTLIIPHLPTDAAVKGSSSRPFNNGQSTIYDVPCNAKFSLSTIIGGQTWQVDQTLLVQKSDNGTCVSNIQGWADPNTKQYLFGSAFLSSLYL